MSKNSINRSLNIYINSKHAKNSLNDIREKMLALRRETSKLTRGTIEYEQKAKELRKISKIYRDMRVEINGTTNSFARMTGMMGKAFGAMGITAGVYGLINSLQSLTSANAVLADAQTDVAKTTNLSDEAVEKLTVSLKNMDTRTPLLGLMALGEEAGRLGKKSVKDVLEFVKTADKISVALGDDLNGDINENVRVIGKMVEQYRVGAKQNATFGKSMEMLGSAINEVSASGSNQAGFLVDYLKRVSGVSRQTGIAAEQQIGFAAALDEAGQSVEVSGTTMNKVLIDMFKNTDKYAKIAGMSIADYGKLLKTDANEAMLKFLEGVKKSGGGMQEMVGHFNDLKMDGARAVAVLTSLAGNTDKVREKQALANKALLEATSLTDEFNKKNRNLAGNLEKVGKKFKNYFINSAIKDTLNSWVLSFGELIGAIKKTSDKLEKERVQLLMTSIQIKNVNTKTEDRIKLIKELQSKYPKLLGNLDAEKVSNEELSKAIKQVNEELINKIILAKNQEKIDEIQSKRLEWGVKAKERELSILEKIVKLSEKYNIKINDDIPLIEQAEFLYKEILKTKKEGFFSNESNALQGDIFWLKQERKAVKAYTNDVDNLYNQREKLKAQLGINLSSTNIDKNDTNGTNDTNGDNDTKTTDSAKTTKTVNLYEKMYKQLTKLRIDHNKLNLDLMNDGFEKEKEAIIVNFDQKKAQIENQMISETEIRKLGTQKEKDVAVSINKELTEQIAIQEQIKNVKIASLQEKYFKINLDKKRDALDRELQLMETKHDEALASIKTFEDAKQYLTADELKGVKTVADAKALINDKFREEELKKELEFIAQLQKILNDTLSAGNFHGIDLLTEEQKEAVKLRLQDLAAEAAKIKVNLNASEDGEDATDLGAAGDIDILGFSVEQWDATFSNLETTAQKIQAAEMVVQGLMNAWKMMYDFQRANDEAALRSYESSLDKRKSKLKKQLDEGYITEAQYKSKLEKLDADLEKRKADIAYQAAKRDRTMALMGAITNTALGVTKALPNIPLAYVVGGLGALQIATIAATPLPERGYATGGFTNGLGYKDDSGHEVAGVVHANEYVVPDFVMSDPAVPAIIKYLEAKRTGISYADGGATETTTTTLPQDNEQDIATTTDVTMLAAQISRLNAVLEKGIEAKIFFGNKDAFEIDKLMKENQNIRDNARV